MLIVESRDIVNHCRARTSIFNELLFILNVIFKHLIYNLLIILPLLKFVYLYKVLKFLFCNGKSQNKEVKRGDPNLLWLSLFIIVIKSLI